MLKPVAALVTCAALLLGVGRLALGQSGSDTLAVDVSVDEAGAQLAAAEADLEDLRAQLAVLQLERTEYSRRLEQRHSRLSQAADDLRSARTTAQRLAVQAYMGAGSAPTPETIAYSNGDPLEYLYRTTLVAESTDARYRAAAYYHELRDQAHDAVASTVEHLDDLDEAIALTQLALGEAEDAQRTAAVILAEAEAEAQAAERAARQSTPVPGGPPAEPPPDGYVPLGQWPGGPSYDQWAALRNCESGGNYQAVSPSGLYRGAYQFDLGTWASVGGSGDPAVASPEEQDHRAQVLWSQRGAAPWPVCGRYLTCRHGPDRYVRGPERHRPRGRRPPVDHNPVGPAAPGPGPAGAPGSAAGLHRRRGAGARRLQPGVPVALGRDRRPCAEGRDRQGVPGVVGALRRAVGPGLARRPGPSHDGRRRVRRRPPGRGAGPGPPLHPPPPLRPPRR